MAGRKPKHPNLVALEGNRGHRPLRSAGPTPTPIRRVVAPDWFDAEMRSMLADWTKELRMLDMLNSADKAVLIGAAAAYGNAVKSQKDGELNQAAKHWALMRSLCSEIGLTPVARMKLASASKSVESDDLERAITG